MKNRFKLFMLFLLSCTLLSAAEKPKLLLIVTQDGSGDFTSVQEAIDAVAEGTRGIIFIRNGVYDENIYAGTSVDKNKYISLIGKSRDGTILTSSIDRGEKNPDNNYLD